MTLSDLSDLAKYSMTWSIARPLCYSRGCRATCRYLFSLDTTDIL